MNKKSIVMLAALALLSSIFMSCNNGHKDLKDTDCLVQFLKQPESNFAFSTFGPKEYNLNEKDTISAVNKEAVISFEGRTSADNVCVIMPNDDSRILFQLPQEGGVTFVEREIEYKGKKGSFFENTSPKISEINKAFNALARLEAEQTIEYLDFSARWMAKNESEADALQEEFEVISKEQIKNQLDFIKNNPNLAGEALLLERIQSYLEYIDELRPAIEKMPDNALRKQILHQVELNDKIRVGAHFVDVELPTPEGKMLRLSDIAGKGKPVLLDFWASWCGPCRGENPHFVEIYNKYHAKGFDIYAVSLDKDAEAWKAAIAADKLTWHHVSNLKFWDCPARDIYMIQGIPSNVLLDGDGIIVAKNVMGDALCAKLDELFAK